MREQFKEPINLLQRLLDEQISKGREANNRSLLWVRLSLATILREVDKPKEDVLELFGGIVTSEKEGNLAKDEFEYVESTHELALAEEALRLVRSRKKEDADKLLQANGLTWTRIEDFWLFEGGPGTDTLQMNGP